RSLTIGLNCLGGLFQQLGRSDEALNAFQRQVAISETLNDQRSLTIGLNCLGGLFQQLGRSDEALNAFQRQVAISETLNDQRSLTIGLNCLGGLFQQLGRSDEALNAFHRPQTLTLLSGVVQQQRCLEEAIDALERAIQLYEKIGNKQQQIIVLADLAGVLHQQGCLLLQNPENWDKAEALLRRSQEIFEDLESDRPLAMVLNSLGGLLRKRREWDEAEHIIRCSYDLAVKVEDLRAQAIVLNSLAQVLQRQESEEKFSQAIAAFKQSIKLGKQINDLEHLAKVHTAMGQALIHHRNFEEAAAQLTEGFKIDEGLKNKRGLELVTPNLTYALTMSGKGNEAITYCQKALEIAPKSQRLLELYDRIVSPKPPVEKKMPKRR
ncbi:tetratricopeptide repeat protein, partial [Laspinema olomoucense]|uniref:tetratricopeptide repeat protein n=1 Tax=Laspinema olomoucense TaxID=3231600 RepID=UPI0021BAFAD4